MRIRGWYAARQSVVLRHSVLMLLCVGVLTHSTAHANTADFLISKLQSSSHFRVRAQAALSLSQVPASTRVVNALTMALKDAHPAVRSSAAASLQRLGNPSALPALKALLHDSDTTVRRAAQRAIQALEEAAPPGPGPALYYVGVGTPGSNAPGAQGATLERYKQLLKQRVAAMDGVKLAREGETEKQVRATLKKDNLVGYYIDSSIVKVERCPEQGVRAEVSVILSTYPEHDIRAMLSGAARVSGGGDLASMRAQAIEGAFSGALKRLPQAMQQASEGR